MAQSVQEILHLNFDIRVHKRWSNGALIDKLQRLIIKASQSEQAETTDISLILHQV